MEQPEGRAAPTPPAAATTTSGGPVRLTLGTGVAAGGDGIGRLGDGRVVFVEGGLPGETVAAEVVEVHRDYARARVADVVAASPDRVAPPCPSRLLGCGGCGWQHVAADAQVRLKEAIVADALRRAGGVQQSVPMRSVRLPAGGYRTTVHLAVGRDGRPAYRLGRSQATVAPSSCLVAHPSLEELIVGSRLPGVRRVTLRVGVAGGERLAVVDRRPAAPVTLPAGASLIGPRGRGFVHEDAGGRRWRVGAASFFQAGPAAAGPLAASVLAALGDGPVGYVVDLYAGVGLLGGVAASRLGSSLLAVERSPSAVADARHNLADLDARIVASEVGRWRPEVVRGLARGTAAADAVIADPARPGLGRPGVGAVSATGAGVLALVSCDPASLGRDARLLAGDGWRLASVTLVDAFPQTPHVECVSRFER